VPSRVASFLRARRLLERPERHEVRAQRAAAPTRKKSIASRFAARHAGEELGDERLNLARQVERSSGHG